MNKLKITSYLILTLALTTITFTLKDKTNNREIGFTAEVNANITPTWASCYEYSGIGRYSGIDCNSCDYVSDMSKPDPNSANLCKYNG